VFFLYLLGGPGVKALPLEMIVFLPEEMIVFLLVAVFVPHPPDHPILPDYPPDHYCLPSPSPFLSALLVASFLLGLFPSSHPSWHQNKNALHSWSRLLIVDSTIHPIRWRRKEYPWKEDGMMERNMMTG